MEAHGLADPFLIQLERDVEAGHSGHISDQELRATINEICLQYAAELRQRVLSQEDEP